MKKINSYFLITRKKIPAYLKYYWSKITSEIKTKVEGIPPLILLKSLGKNLINYLIYGNSVQDGTPTPSAPIEIVSCGDRTGNLFDYKTVYEPYIDSNGNISTTANVLASWNYFAEADVGKTITVSLYVGSISASYIRVQGQIDGSYITGNAINAGSKGYTEITVTPTSTSDRWRIIYGAGTPSVVLNQVMVAVSATRKDYEPYGYKIPVIVGSTTTNIYLDEPLRKIGEYSDYIDFENSKVVRNIAKKVLNGTEDWGMPGTIIPGYSSYRIINFIPNIPLQTPIEELLCTHFEAFPKSQYQQEPIQNKITSYGNTNQIIILVSNNIADSNNQTTTANWINWLSNNNITLYYSKKQPTEETIALPNIPTIKGTTVIEIDTEIQPSKIEVEYLRGG